MLEEGHESDCPGAQPFVEGFEGAFPADRIAEEYHHKIDLIEATAVVTGKAHALAYGHQHALLVQARREHRQSRNRGGGNGKACGEARMRTSDEALLLLCFSSPDFPTMEGERARQRCSVEAFALSRA